MIPELVCCGMKIMNMKSGEMTLGSGGCGGSMMATAPVFQFLNFLYEFFIAVCYLGHIVDLIGHTDQEDFLYR